MVTHFGQTLPYVDNHIRYIMFDAVKNELGKTYRYKIEVGEMKAGSDIVRVLKSLQVQGDDLPEVLEHIKLCLDVVDKMELN